MRKKTISLLAFTLAVCFSHCSPCSAGAFQSETDNEVHLVSIYEGYEKSKGKIHGPRANVHVDRPGKEVTLVLTSYDGATWQITTTTGTKIREVILGGYEEQAVKGVSESTKVTKVWRGQSDKPLSYSHRSEGAKFRQLVKQVHALTGTELSSFYGTYRSVPDVPLVVDAVQENPTLLSSYPQPTKDLPSNARDVTFVAHRYVAGPRRFDLSSSFGEHTPTGPIEKELKSLPRGVKRIAYDANNNVHYGISDHAVFQVDLEADDVKEMKLGLDVPTLHWVSDITFDTKRKRVIVGSRSGGDGRGDRGYLYAYSTEKQQWSVISKNPMTLRSFAYSPADDFIYGVFFSHSEAGKVASLAKVNAEGKIVDSFKLGPPIGPGSLNLDAGVSTTQVAIAGDYIAILSSPSNRPSSKIDAASIYLVDPATREVWLTSKKPKPVR